MTMFAHRFARSRERHESTESLANSDAVQFSLFGGNAFFAHFEEMPVRLTIPEPTAGWILIGNSRRNRQLEQLATTFFGLGLATISIDLRMAHDGSPRSSAQHVGHLSDRLIKATRWVEKAFNHERLPMGFFGAGLDGTAALSSAARLGTDVRAIVVWDGRPDLIQWQLPHLSVPTLFVVNAANDYVRQLNYQALHWMTNTRQVYESPRSPWRFSDRTAIPAVSDLACDWYCRYLLRRQPLKGFQGGSKRFLSKEFAQLEQSGPFP